MNNLERTIEQQRAKLKALRRELKELRDANERLVYAMREIEGFAQMYLPEEHE